MSIRCPKCGESPRVVVFNRMRVRCQINADGTIGKVLSAGGGHCWKWKRKEQETPHE